MAMAPGMKQKLRIPRGIEYFTWQRRWEVRRREARSHSAGNGKLAKCVTALQARQCRRRSRRHRGSGRDGSATINSRIFRLIAAAVAAIAQLLTPA